MNNHAYKLCIQMNDKLLNTYMTERKIQFTFCETIHKHCFKIRNWHDLSPKSTYFILMKVTKIAKAVLFNQPMHPFKGFILFRNKIYGVYERASYG